MDKLPQEILQYIINFLEPKLIDQARSVCSGWFKIINKRSFTLYCIKNQDIADIERIFSRYTIPIKIRFKQTKRIAENQLAESLARLTQLTSLSIITDQSSQAWLTLTALSGLKELKLEDPPMDLISKLPRLNKLHLCRMYRFMNALHVFSSLTALQDLKITFSDQDDYTGLLSSLPNPSILTSLVFNGSNMGDFAALERFYNMKHLVLDYWSQQFESETPFPVKFSALESLTINGTNVSVEDITTNTTLTHLTLASVDCSSLENFSRLVHLQTLVLAGVSVTSNENEERNLEFLTNLSSLRRLTLEEVAGKFSAYLPTNLTYLAYSKYECEDLEWTRLQNLRDLEFTVQNPGQNLKDLFNMEKCSKLSRIALKLHTINSELIQKMPTTLRQLDLYSSTTNVVEMDLENRLSLEKLVFVNVIVDPICLDKLSDLTRMELFSANWWQPELMNLSALQHLTYLKLTQDKDGTAQTFLPLLTNLRELVMTPLSDDTIRQLTSLKRLNFLMCMELESEGYALTCLTSLQRVIIQPNLQKSTESKASIKEKLFKALPIAKYVFIQ